MRSIRSIPALATVLLAGLCDAQTTGSLRLYIDPGNNFEFIVDRTYRMRQRQVELAAGTHRLTFWAPQRLLVDTNVTIEPGITRDLVMHLPYAPEYITYNKQLSAFRKKRNALRFIPLGITAASGAWTLTRYVKMRDARNVLDGDQRTYDRSVVPADIAQLKNETIPAHNDDLQKARTSFIIGSSLTIASAAATVWLWRKAGKLDVPAYEDKEKIKFDGIAWTPLPQGGWMGGIMLTLR